MPELISNLFEREAFRQQMRRASVSKTVRAARNTLNAYSAKPPSHNQRDAVRRESPTRRLDGQKHGSTAASRPRMLQVAQERVADRADERIRPGVPLLGASDVDELVLEIEVFETQSSYFAASQSIGRQEHHDRTVSDRDGIVAVQAREQRLHLLPLRATGQALLGIQGWRVDRVGKSVWTPALHLRVAKEAALGASQCRQRRAAPTVLALLDEISIDVSQGDLLTAVRRSQAIFANPP